MEQKDILVSIVVPIYNVEKFLGENITCLINQTHKNIEIILVDDGSKDSSGDIADEYAKNDSRIKVIHIPNGGVSNARNVGIESCKGEYVCFADADDTLDADYVEYLLRLAVGNKAEVAMTRDMYNSYRLKQNSNYNKTEVISAYDAAFGFLYYYYPIGVYSKIFSRDFLNRNNIRFIRKLFVGEGFNFNMAALQRANKVVVGYKRIYTYRLTNDISCMTAFNQNKVECGIYALSRIRQDLLYTDKKMLRAWEFANWTTYCSMLMFIKAGHAEKQVNDLYKRYMFVVKRKAYVAFPAPVPISTKIRALIMMFYPPFFHHLRYGRRRIISSMKNMAKYIN